MTDKEIENRIYNMTKRLSLRMRIRDLIEHLRPDKPHPLPSNESIARLIQGYLERKDLSTETRFVLKRLLNH